MALAIRMALYAVFAGLAGAEVGSFNDATGDYTVNAETVADLLIYAGGFLATFLGSRWAKARGGKT